MLFQCEEWAVCLFILCKTMVLFHLIHTTLKNLQIITSFAVNLCRQQKVQTILALSIKRLMIYLMRKLDICRQNMYTCLVQNILHRNLPAAYAVMTNI